MIVGNEVIITWLYEEKRKEIRNSSDRGDLCSQKKTVGKRASDQGGGTLPCCQAGVRMEPSKRGPTPPRNSLRPSLAMPTHLGGCEVPYAAFSVGWASVPVAPPGPASVPRCEC